MSVKITERVWPLDLPSPEKLVLLRFGDRASDNGSGIWESVPSLAKRCGLSVRGVQEALRRLEGRGHIQMVKEADHARKLARVYRVMVETLNSPITDLDRCRRRTGAGGAPNRCRRRTGTGAGGAPSTVKTNRQ